MQELQYIIETFINGNKSHAKKEFKTYLHYSDTLYIDTVNCSELFGIRKTVEVLKQFNLSDTNIINSFYDNDRCNLDEVKGILLNNFNI